MSFLLPLAGSIFSSPLVQNTLGTLANGAIKTLKTAAMGFLNSGGEQIQTALDDKVNQISKVATNYAQFQPEYYSRPNKRGKRRAIVDEEDEYPDQPPPTRRKQRPRSRIRNERPVYNPDLITDFEE